MHLRRAEPALRDSPLRIAGSIGHAIAFERGDAAERLVVAVNAGEDAVSLGIELDDAPGAGPATALVPVELPGFTPMAASAVVGSSATIELPPRSGTVLRVT